MNRRSSWPRTLLRIGHRGASGHAPENTLASLECAIRLDVDFVEFDVRKSAEGKLVLIHDETVDRTTNGNGRVESMPLHVLREFDAGEGERIPLLEEALVCLNGRTGAMIELKVPGIASEVCRVVDAVRFRGRCIYASFLHDELQTVRVLKPNAEILALFEDSSDGSLVRVRDIPATHVGVAEETVTPEVVQMLQNSGLEVFVYTVDEPEDIIRMKRLGVDGIISNFPERI